MDSTFKWNHIFVFLSIWLQLVWPSLCPSMLLQRLNSIPLYVCTPSSSFIHTDAFLNCITLVSGSLGSGFVRMHPGKGVLWEHSCDPSICPQTQLWVCLLSLLALLRVTVAQKQDLLITVCSSLQNLDALHDHLATIYPGMRAPSFRCTDAEKGKGLILHYYSEREGLQDIVIGIIKTVAQQIHGTEIDMKVMGNKGGSSEHRWHVVLERLPVCPWTSLLVDLSRGID